MESMAQNFDEISENLSKLKVFLVGATKNEPMSNPDKAELQSCCPNESEESINAMIASSPKTRVEALLNLSGGAVNSVIERYSLIRRPIAKG